MYDTFKDKTCTIIFVSGTSTASRGGVWVHATIQSWDTNARVLIFTNGEANNKPVAIILGVMDTLSITEE